MSRLLLAGTLGAVVLGAITLFAFSKTGAEVQETAEIETGFIQALPEPEVIEKPIRTSVWPLYGRDLTRTHSLPGPGFGAKLKEVWHYNARRLVEQAPSFDEMSLYGSNITGWVYAVDRRTGRERWRRRLGALAASTPAVSRGRIYAVTLRPGRLWALNRDGKTLWKRELSSRSESSPAPVGGSVLVGAENGIVRSYSRSGKLIWSRLFAGAVKGSLAVDRRRGLAYVGDYSGRLWCLRVSDGSPRWVRRLDGPVYATPSLAAGKVFVGTTAGTLHATSALSGKAKWSYRTGGYIYAASAVGRPQDAPLTVFVGSYDGHLYALSALGGKLVWSRRLGGPISGAPSLIGDNVYAADLKTTNTVSLRGRDGKLVRRWPDGAYNPATSDGRTLYLTGVRRIRAYRPK